MTVSVPQAPQPASDFSPAQWKVLMAIADTVVAPLTDKETQDVLINSHSMSTTQHTRAARDFAKLKFSGDSALCSALRKNLGMLDQVKRDEIARVLTALDWHLGALALHQTYTKFSDMAREDREAVLLKWYSSPLGKIRSLPRGVVGIVCATFARHYDLKFLDYDLGEYIHNLPIDFETPDYKFLEPQPENDEVFTDVLIIGSGSGGAVSAATLAKAGKRVLVVDKGRFYKPADHFPMTEANAWENLYENRGLTMTDDGAMIILAGSTFGGGSTVNWSASLQTPRSVRKEWFEKTGIKWFLTNEFQDSLDFVCGRMGVSAANIRHNNANARLLEGSRRLGHYAYAVPQNTGGKEHYCGHCGHGCKNGGKCGALVSWLKDAKDHGAQFMQECQVEKITFDKKNKATGALVHWRGRPLKLRAERVIVAAGSLNTPVVLQRSGLRNKEIGRQLKLHPCGFVAAFYEDKPTRPHEGGILTTLSTAVANRDGKGHGAVLEAMSNQPGLFSATLGWRGAAEWKRTMLKYPHSALYIALSRDRDGGSVTTDPVTHKAVINYPLSRFDAESITLGVIGLCDVSLMAGADEIITCQNTVPAFRPDKSSKLGTEDPKYKAWIELVRKAGIRNGEAALGSAHQMASCSIGRVCDENCQVYGAKGLYISDASVFPTCSGVNPMITTMALAHRTALQIIRDDEKANRDVHKAFQPTAKL
ncbi:hypothetical protein PYCC9005_003147 [Savitreella phatthalungensis]